MLSLSFALGSYYKSIPVIERLPFKIESVNQVKDLPAIRKLMHDHVSERYLQASLDIAFSITTKLQYA